MKKTKLEKTHIWFEYDKTIKTIRKELKIRSAA